MTPAAAPAPLPPPRRRRGLFERRDQLSLPGLLHAVETHPELPAPLRSRVLDLRREVASRALVIDVQPQVDLLGGGA